MSLLHSLFFTAAADPRWLSEDESVLHVRTGIADAGLDFTVQTPGDDATFTTDTPGGPVVDFAYKKLSLGVRLPFGDESSDAQKYGRTTSTDLQLRVFGHRTSPEFIYQKFDGYYPEQWVDASGQQVVRSDIQSELFAFNVIQSLSPAYFSQVIAFDQRGNQLKPGGSLLLFASLTSLQIKGDSAWIPTAQQGRAGQLGAIQDYHSDSLVVGSGYGWVLPFWQNLYFAGALMGGFGQHRYSVQRNGQTTWRDAPVTRTGLRLGLGYNGLLYFGGLQLVVDSNSARVLDSQIQNATIKALLFFGYRFGPVKIPLLDSLDSALEPLRF